MQNKITQITNSAGDTCVQCGNHIRTGNRRFAQVDRAEYNKAKSRIENGVPAEITGCAYPSGIYALQLYVEYHMDYRGPYCSMACGKGDLI